MTAELSKIRNIGVIAHIDAGKTTVTERILYYTGKTYKMGEVHEGTAVMDYLPEEQERGITITAAATTCPWKGYTINLIDTPGHVDFTVEVERSLRVLDGGVVVFDAKEGVEAQSETVWRQADKYRVPRLCFINKMDKVGADFPMCLQTLVDRLGANPCPIQIPILNRFQFLGVIDLVRQVAVFSESEDLGRTQLEEPIPLFYTETAARARHEMLEKLADFDEELMDAYVHEQPVGEQVIVRAIRAGTVSGRLHPVLCGSALRYQGIQRLLDAVCAYLPSPTEVPPVNGHEPRTDNLVERPADPEGPLAALVFKITADQHGDLSYVRIYSGRLSTGTRVYNPNRDKKENITRLWEMHAADRVRREDAQAGDIVAVVGLKHSLTGDTLCDAKHPVLLEKIEFPETVISMSIEPASSADKVKLATALEALGREDPTFTRHVNEETGQMLISGMGELHLEVIRNRLVRDMGVPVRVGTPQVAYKETVTGSAEAEGKFIRQTGGRGQYGHVVMKVEPHAPGPDEPSIAFESEIYGGTVPREYWPAVERGVRDQAASGVLAGYPLINVKATLLDGSFHEVDSSEIAFSQAGAIAFRDGVMRSGPVLLEPVMKLEVVCPAEFIGVVQADLNSRRAVITRTSSRGKAIVVDADVPLAEMFGYATVIRSLTQGRASYTLEPKTYAIVPSQISRHLLEVG